MPVLSQVYQHNANKRHSLTRYLKSHQGQRDCDQRSPLCGRLCPQCQQRARDANGDDHNFMNRFSSASDNFWLTISTKKTKVMFQPAPRNPYQQPNITVKGQRLQSVNNFTLHLPCQYTLTLCKRRRRSDQQDGQGKYRIREAQEDSVGTQRHLTEASHRNPKSKFTEQLF